VKRIGSVLFPAFLLTATAAAEMVELPLETSRSGSAILVRAVINHRPAILVLDTGAALTVIGPELARLETGDLAPTRFSADGPGLEARGRWVEATLEIGGRRFGRRTIGAMRLEEVSRALGEKVDGLLGQDLLREFGQVTIDFRRRMVRLGERD
jgi:hypothetical protein